jgi:hypothetical protein
MPRKGATISESHRNAIIESNRLTKRKYPVGSDTYTRLYTIWKNMMRRCSDPKDHAYPRYGGRGIGVCLNWQRYEPFRAWALSAGYQDDLEMDRRENGRGYAPDNCRWVKRRVNALNRSDNLPHISAFGEAKQISTWHDDPRCRVTYRTLWRRLAAGWPPEQAISTPSQARGPRTVGFATGGLRPKGSQVSKQWRT